MKGKILLKLDLRNKNGTEYFNLQGNIILGPTNRAPIVWNGEKMYLQLESGKWKLISNDLKSAAIHRFFCRQF